MIVCPACSNRYGSAETACPKCGLAPPRLDGFPAWAPELAEAGGGFKPGYFSELARTEGGNFWFEARNALLVWALRRFFPGFESFLEIGCGTGFVLQGISKAFPGARLTGTEIFTAGLVHASARLQGVELMQMDARRIPFADEFDVAGAFDVLEHIEEDELVLLNLKQAVRPGGGVLLTVPQHTWLWSAADSYAMHVRRYEAAELHRKVAAAGLTIRHSTSFVSLLLPLMLASRRFKQEQSGYDPMAEFRMSPLLNSVLSGAMSIERATLRLGARYSWGGSRLVVAQRL